MREQQVAVAAVRRSAGRCARRRTGSRPRSPATAAAIFERRLARLDDAPRQVTAARRRADDQAAVGDRAAHVRAPRARSAARRRRPRPCTVASVAGKRSGRHQAAAIRAPWSSWRGPLNRCCRGARCRRGRCGWTCSGILAVLWRVHAGRSCPPANVEKPHAHAADCSTSPSAPRAARETSSCATSTGCRPCSIRAKSRNDFVTEIDQHGRARHHRDGPPHRTPTTASSPRKAAAAAATSSSGSSTRSTAPPISCTASRCSRCRSPSSTAAGSSTRVVYDPMRQELFTASRGDGAQLDGKRIRVSKQTELEGALIGTGLPVPRQRALDRRIPGDAQGR